ncbi:MAG: hypothetical protein DME46_05345 [Verrucomicrobia bacterium]|nr:MAG: hypothetical protein DME46_05345 [Verrucomicrobiota bacterium]
MLSGVVLATGCSAGSTPYPFVLFVGGRTARAIANISLCLRKRSDGRAWLLIQLRLISIR